MSHKAGEVALYGLFGAGAGIYFAIKAHDREERKYAMLLTAGGIATFAIGYYLLVNYSISFQSPEVITKTVSCDVALSKLQEIRESVQPTSDVGGLIDAVDTSCANFLPWENSFIQGTDYIDGISTTDMTGSVMWGIDPWDRFYVAMKHSCDKAQEGIVAIFQRYSEAIDKPLHIEGGDRNIITWGGRYISENCFPYARGKKLLDQTVALIKKGASGDLVLVD